MIPRGVHWDLKAEVWTSDITQRPNSETSSTPLRVTPFNLQDKVGRKVPDLLDYDIIKEVDNPTPWVKPVVIIPKMDEDIWLCIDVQGYQQ